MGQVVVNKARFHRTARLVKKTIEENTGPTRLIVSNRVLREGAAVYDFMPLTGCRWGGQILEAIEL